MQETERCTECKPAILVLNVAVMVLNLEGEDRVYRHLLVPPIMYVLMLSVLASWENIILWFQKN